MAKTIVTIIEEEMILNYLFIKELYKQGDKLLFISSKQLSHLIPRFSSLFSIEEGFISSIVFERNEDDKLWDTICRTIRRELKEGVEYVVNLSGGTRLISIATAQVFEKFNTQFYFMPLDKDVIVNSQIDDVNDNNDDIINAVTHKVTVDEYLKVNGIVCSRKQLCKSEEYSQQIYEMFTNGHFTSRDFDLFEQLRELRNSGVEVSKINGLSSFLKYIAFEQQEEGILLPEEVQYLTGNWFEEFIYFLVKKEIDPTDIAVGVDIRRIGSNNHNDLDVVFTYKNRLYAIECKTGVGKAALYHQIVYKACALKEALLGMRSNGYIFSLNEDHENRLKITAKNMGISFCDRSYTQNGDMLRNLFMNPNMFL